MRESFTYGSVRGAGSNARPYRDNRLLTWDRESGMFREWEGQNDQLRVVGFMVC